MKYNNMKPTFLLDIKYMFGHFIDHKTFMNPSS